MAQKNKSKLFTIIGIRHPGKVDLYQIGTVNLYDLPDDKLLEIYRAKACPYLKPTPEGLKIIYPETNIKTTKRKTKS